MRPVDFDVAPDDLVGLEPERRVRVQPNAEHVGRHGSSYERRHCRTFGFLSSLERGSPRHYWCKPVERRTASIVSARRVRMDVTTIPA